MLCDHFAAICLPENMILYDVLRLVIGRISFPIFCVLFIESFFYISVGARWKHIRDLLICACISELPYDIALMSSSGLNWNHQNVFFSWALGFLLLILLAELESFTVIYSYAIWFVQCLLICLTAVFAEWCGLDYGACCQICIGLGYFVKKTWDDVPTFVLGIVVSILLVSTYGTWFVFLSVLIFMFYDCNKSCRKNKYLYYVGYPVHLILFILLMQFI